MTMPVALRLEAVADLESSRDWYDNVRAGLGFPYIVYYRILTGRIEVIAVLHGSRDPQTWKDRI
jgi:plasmid stabilization system protein ParE